MDDDDEWFAPEPWGWKGNSASIGAIVATAIALHFSGWGKPKPVKRFEVIQWQPIRNSAQWCHVARFYYDGKVWRCV